MTRLAGICISGMVKMHFLAAGAGGYGCWEFCCTKVEVVLELGESDCG